MLLFFVFFSLIPKFRSSWGVEPGNETTLKLGGPRCVANSLFQLLSAFSINASLALSQERFPNKSAKLLPSFPPPPSPLHQHVSHTHTTVSTSGQWRGVVWSIARPNSGTLTWSGRKARNTCWPYTTTFFQFQLNSTRSTLRSKWCLIH